MMNIIMSDSIVAYRYAKALIDLANERGVVNEVNEDMAFFVKVCEENRAFLTVMGNPIVRHDKKLGILKNIFENRVNNVTYSIFHVLTKKNREKLIYSIAKEFHDIYNEQKGIQKVSVTTVSELTKEQKDAFVKLVSDAIDKKVELEEKIDENLIGGYLLKVGDKQIDTSVRKRINELKLSLN